MIVRELELDLDAFEGPFDLLLTLILKDELDLRELDVAGIVLAFIERLAEREALDLEACGEFLVLVSALLELKARGLFPEEAAELAELEPGGRGRGARAPARRVPADEERGGLASGAARDARASATSGSARRRSRRRSRSRSRRRIPSKLAQVIRLLAVEPPQVSLAHMALRFPP